ncbi:MAG: cytochrome c [Halioglobus sp.]|nr:cytochrome c [Halioglobus sp.]
MKTVLYNSSVARWLPAVLLAFAVASAHAETSSEASGRKQLLSCVACHGADGIGKAPDYPNLRGQKAAYLEKQLKAYRSGERVSPDMSRMARGLSDADIRYIAEFFANLK